MEYGLQMFSVRNAAKADFEGTLRVLAEMGYSFIETAGLWGHTAKEIREMADRHGFKIRSTHIAFQELFDDFDNTVKYHKELGCSDIVLAWGGFYTAPEVEYFIENINRCIPKLKEEGMRLHFHNHAAEFFPNQDGVIAMTEYLNRTEIMLEPDVYWLSVAGVDPVEFIEKYKDRISMVHLKDGMMFDPTGPYPSGCSRALGLGEVKIAEVRAKAIELGLDMIAETEGASELEIMKNSIGYLKTLDA